LIKKWKKKSLILKRVVVTKKKYLYVFNNFSIKFWWLIWFPLNTQEELYAAFKAENEKKFINFLDLGADPGKLVPGKIVPGKIVNKKSQATIFELLCAEPKASKYIKLCIDGNCVPNRVSILFSL
jgi:hypothetical protein